MRFIVFIFLSSLLACSAEGTRSSDTEAAQVFTLIAGQGIDFTRHKKLEKGNHTNADLYTVFNGAGTLQLWTGGRICCPSGDCDQCNNTVGTACADGFTCAHIKAKLKPVNWFLGNGGVPKTFESLEEVPLEQPSANDVPQSLLHVATGNAFVLENSQGFGYTRGYVVEAIEGNDGGSVTIKYDFL